jgi:hypothetical protein
MDSVLRILKILLHKFVKILELEIISLNRFNEMPLSAVNAIVSNESGSPCFTYRSNVPITMIPDKTIVLLLSQRKTTQTLFPISSYFV